MKPILHLLNIFVILCFLQLLSAKHIRTQAHLSFQGSETKESLKKKIEAVIKKTIPGFNTNDNNVDGDTAITEITNDFLEKDLTDLKAFEWFEAKKFFANKDGSEIMLKFLHLRFKDTFMMIDQVFSDTSVFTRTTAETQSTFTGKFKSFKTPEVTVNIGEIKLNNKVEKSQKIKGNFVFGSSGSQSMKSDIDFQVRFEGPKPGPDPSIHECLLALYQFISAYNTKFLKLHGSNSLVKYDVNMYASDFGNKDLLTTVDTLRKDTKEEARWKKFAKANRYAQLHIVFNDAVETFERIAKQKVSFDSKLGDKLKLLIADGGHCVSNLFVSPDGKQVLQSTKSRNSISDDERNTIMVKNVEKAGRNMDSDTDPSDSMCHSLAANFYALEAYVSVGSVVEMLRVQGASHLDFYELKEDDYVDSVLMNFAYGIQHYYEQLSSDPEGANDKIAKYLVRLYRSSTFLKKNKDHHDCWGAALKPLELTPEEVKDKATVEKTIKKHKETWAAGAKWKGDTVKAIAVAGFKCANDYGFSFEDSSSASTTTTGNQNTQTLSHSASLTNLNDPKSLKNPANAKKK